jgi:hypothetical protein
MIWEDHFTLQILLEILILWLLCYEIYSIHQSGLNYTVAIKACNNLKKQLLPGSISMVPSEPILPKPPYNTFSSVDLKTEIVNQPEKKQLHGPCT